MTQHTPGPWTIDFDDIGNGSCQWGIAGGDHLTVATSPVGPHAFDKANARLIAAAPELLQALRFERQLEAANDAEAYPQFREMRDAAIAKAEEGS